MGVWFEPPNPFSGYATGHTDRFERLPAPPHVPMEQPISAVCGGRDPIMFGGCRSLATVLDFPIFLSLWNGRAQSVDFGSANWGFRLLNFRDHV